MAKLPHSSARRTISGMTASSTRKLMPQFVEPTCPWKTIHNHNLKVKTILQDPCKGQAVVFKGDWELQREELRVAWGLKIQGGDKECRGGVGGGITGTGNTECEEGRGYLPMPTELPWVPQHLLAFLAPVSEACEQTVPHHSKVEKLKIVKRFHIVKIAILLKLLVNLHSSAKHQDKIPKLQVSFFTLITLSALQHINIVRRN